MMYIVRGHFTDMLYDSANLLVTYVDGGKQIHCFCRSPVDAASRNPSHVVLEIRGKALVLLKAKLIVQRVEAWFIVTLHVVPSVSEGAEHPLYGTCVRAL